MSDTPETDLEDDLFVDCDNPRFQCPAVKESTGAHLTCDFVPAEFARRLERERDRFRAINAELFVAVEVALDDWQDGFESRQTDSYDIAREALTKAKAIKL